LTAGAVEARLRRARYTVGQEGQGIGSYMAKDDLSLRERAVAAY